jgi:choline dehydrogenase-like flavoprotein
VTLSLLHIVLSTLLRCYYTLLIDKYSQELANSSDQVGRNFETAVVSIHLEVNHANFQKTLFVNDFYWGEPNFPYAMGMVQNMGNVLADMFPAETPPLMAPLIKLVPYYERHLLAERSIGWYLQTEDLPDPNNRIRVVGDKIHVDYRVNNIVARDRLLHRWTSILQSIPGSAKKVLPFSIYPRTHIPERAVAHQCNTSCRFGTNPKTSVLDLNCRTHNVNNLHVVDSSFFPSNSGVNPTSTVMANALHIGDFLTAELR